MENNAQSTASTLPLADRCIDPAVRQGRLIGGSIASRIVNRLFDFLARYGFTRRHPTVANVQEVVPNRRGVRIAAMIASVFGIIALDTSSALAGQCADAIKRIEAALDDLTSNPNASAVHQSLRAQMHRQPDSHSVARGQEQAIADEKHHRAALERARAADAKNDEAACLKALPELRHEVIIR